MPHVALARRTLGGIGLAAAAILSGSLVFAQERPQPPPNIVTRMLDRARPKLAALGLYQREGTPLRFNYKSSGTQALYEDIVFPSWIKERRGTGLEWVRGADVRQKLQIPGQIEVRIKARSRASQYDQQSLWSENFSAFVARMKPAKKSFDAMKLASGGNIAYTKTPYEEHYELAAKSYATIEGELLRLVRTGTYWKTESYMGTTTGIWEPGGPTGVVALKARAGYTGFELPFEMDADASYLGYPGRTELITEGTVDSLMRVLAESLLAELGVPMPAESAPPPPVRETPSPVPPTPPAPAVDPAASNAPIVRPESPAAPAAERLAKMIATFDGLEDELQGSLLQLKMMTDAILKLRSEIGEVDAAIATEQDDSRQAILEKRVAKLRVTLRDLTKLRERQLEAARFLMAATIQTVEDIFAEGGFGDLDELARAALKAAHDRSDFLEAQLYLTTGESDRLLAFAESVRSEKRGFEKAYAFEGLGKLQKGDLLGALEAFRESRRMGMGGEGIEALERGVEVQILRALQSKTTDARGEFEAAFHSWIRSKAELEDDPNKSRFGRFVTWAVWRGWYDTISGLTPAGKREAMERARELGLVADDMARSHLGLGLVIGLREGGYKLDEIARMDRDAFQAAVKKHWGPELSADEADQLRRGVHWAFRLDDLKLLASGEPIDLAGSMSRPVVDEIRVGGFGTRVGEWGAVGGNFVNGWTVFLTLAPNAMLARTAMPMPSAQAADRFRNVMSLGEYFAASAPMQAAIRGLSRVPGGERALETYAQLHLLSQEGVGGASAVALTSMVLGGGAALAAEAMGGENAKLLVEALGPFGFGTPEIVGKALASSGLRRAAAQAAVQSMRLGAEEAAQAVGRLEEVAARTRAALQEAGENALDDAAARSLRDQVNALAGQAPDGLRGTLLRAIDSSAAGRAEVAAAELVHLERSLQRATQRVTAARAAAEDLARAADSVPPRTRVERVLAGDAAAPEGTLRAGAARPDPPPLDADPAAPGVGQPHDSPKFLGADPRAPTRAADALVMKGRFDEALAEYQRILTELGERHRLALAIESKIAFVREVAKAASGRAPAGVAGEAFTETLEREVRDAVKAGRVAPTGAASATPPEFVLDAAGKPIAVIKPANHAAFGDVGSGEEIASRIRALAGREGPVSRLLTLTHADGTTKKYVVIRLFPDGSDLAARIPNLPELVARKDDFAEDMVYSLVVGDGDRHWGNFRVTKDGRMFGYDYGFADLFPEHYYRNPGFDEAAARLRAHEDALERLAQSNLPEAEAANLRGRLLSDGDLAELRQAEFVRGLYRDPRFAQVPSPDSPEFTEFVRGTMERHFRHATGRQWGDGSGVLSSSIRYEDLARHLDDIEMRVKPEIRAIVQQALGEGHPQLHYTEKLLEKRIEILRSFLQQRFPSVAALASRRWMGAAA